ncbi:electron transfer flavoprotein subunit beta (plasmid) [Haloarcula hispanica N601]|uniref:Electron transfer flavoprotein subunit beta n=2 Tax=Haloarcula hispanica TaxID=51589 RepID=V5TSE6_HALHI|nr:MULTISPECIES: electron transfer flavoprotein subunit beta/FixA family protein [Haloarcula]AEM59316.1 electron transfer flavoprotein, beta subunit [Haloarcula hispanica ATCC 33960]AHB68171.1 electron transfer flavoprotein subunit beta [Haloarcula hispanica N601]AJF27508.1 electron transfer flavoprotein subunit beta [Haloarcula sp. CBA1115]
MDTVACIKRVPDTGAKITLTDDEQRIDTSHLGFTISPHEECAVEEAIQVADDHDGTATVMSLGSVDADEQLRTGLAMTADEATLLETDGEEWRPRETAAALADALSGDAGTDPEFDLLLFGNESADVANHQVGVRVAERLDVPFVAGVSDLTIEDGTAVAERDVTGGTEVYELDLPAAVGVREGLNTPRYASMRAKMQARKQSIGRQDPVASEFDGGIEKVRLEAPESTEGSAEVLGDGSDAVPAVVDLLRDDLEVI